MDDSRPNSLRALLAGTALLALTACDEPLDLDLRDLGRGFDTSDAVQSLPNRPRPDDRGVISYPNYQVAVARRGDTPRSVAARLGLDAAELARYNGVDPDVALRRDEVLALPSRVSEPSPATGADSTGPIQPDPINVSELASDAIDRAEPDSPAPAASTQPAQTGAEPIRHQVQGGETVYSIARLYDVPVRGVADWNGLGPDLSVREGQYLLIPVSGAAAPAQPDATEPGTGTPTPTPPSAAQPLPEGDPATPPAEQTEAPEAPDIGQPTAPAATDAPLIYPVRGAIIREYAPGRNEGIDIQVAAGTPVKAAANGTVAAITENTNGAQIVVIRHTGDILTVYVNLSDLGVEKGSTVSQGQQIAKVASGAPAFLHFEVREGLDSVDPADFLP